MPPGPFTFVCYLLYARSDHTMHKFGVAVHFPCSTKSSISTQDRSLKNDSFAVRSDCCRSHGCTWWVLYNFGVWNVDLSHRKFCVSLQASLNNATLKHIKRPQNNCRVFSLPWAARMTGFLSVNRIVNLENACNSFRLCFRIKIYYLKLNWGKKSSMEIIQISVRFHCLKTISLRWMDYDLGSTWFVQNHNSVSPLFQVCSLQYWGYMNVVWI